MPGQISSVIDLRSDTVTRPTSAMMQSILNAPLGDDVIDVDPTVAQLEERTAALLGKERAIFMPSGTMTNQIAVRLHCQPGDEFLCEENCHIYNYEQAAFAQFSGLVARTIAGEAGRLHLDQLRGRIRPDNEHFARTRLVTIENTHNRGGGSVQDFGDVSAICEWARQAGLATHLDGARLMNAVVASGIAADRWAANFDTVSLCFSKGLGAPVGSALAGSAEHIARARRHRKAFGGGMRQAGILAAGALHALEHHIDRLHQDHEHARKLASAISGTDGLRLSNTQVETNILLFEVSPAWGTAAEFLQRLRDRDVLMLSVGPQEIRAVTHLDVSTEQIDAACQILSELGQSYG